MLTRLVAEAPHTYMDSHHCMPPSELMLSDEWSQHCSSGMQRMR